MDLGGLGALISSSTVVNIINTDGTLYVPPTVNSPDNTASTAMIIGVAFAGLVAVILIGVGVFFIVRRMRQKKAMQIDEEIKDEKMEVEPQKGSVQVMELADSSAVIDMPGENTFERWEQSFVMPSTSRRKSRIRGSRD